MRGLLVCSIVALLAVPVFGQGVFSRFHGTVELTTAGATDMGTHWEIAVGDLTDIGGGKFYLDIMVSSTDPEGMSAFGITLDSNPEKLAYDTISQWDYAGLDAGNSTRPGMPNNNWSNLDAYSIPAGVMPMPGPPYQEIGTIYQQNPFAFTLNGLASWVAVGIPTGDANVTIGPSADAPQPYIGDHLFETMAPSPPFNNLTVKPLVITPEPVSTLLLLLGVPFLRRRR